MRYPFLPDFFTGLGGRFVRFFRSLFRKGFLGDFTNARNRAQDVCRLNRQQDEFAVLCRTDFLQSLKVFLAQEVVDGIHVATRDCFGNDGCCFGFRFGLTFAGFRIAVGGFLAAFGLKNGGLLFTFGLQNLCLAETFGFQNVGAFVTYRTSSLPTLCEPWIRSNRAAAGCP